MSADSVSPAASSTPSTDTSSSSVSSTSSSSSPSTADIAASVIRDAESGDQDVPSAPSPEKEPTAADDDDFDATPAERVDALGRKRENAIPHSRVQKMIAKREAKAQAQVIATIAKELGISKAEAELKLEDITGELSTRKTKFSDYEQRIAIADQIDQIMSTDGDRLIQMLAQADPERYGKFAKVLEAASTPSKAQAPAVGDDDPEPEPDYDMGNGQKTYSLEGLRKRDAWRERQIEKRILGQLDQKLSPYEQERKQREARVRAEEVHKQALQAIDSKLAKARKWPMFSDHEDAIAKHIEANPDATLEDAYMSVVIPKIAADRNKIREELVTEQNSKARTTSVTPNVTTPQPPKKRTTADIAKEVMAELGGNN